MGNASKKMGRWGNRRIGEGKAEGKAEGGKQKAE
jgi:hypothetical protein